MHRAVLTIAVCVTTTISLPAAAQGGEWRCSLRLAAFDMEAETDPIFDTGTHMVSDGVRPTLTAEGQYMISDAWGVALSLTPAPFDLVGEQGSLDGRTLGSVWFAPLTLTMRYQLQLYSDFEPYVGAGVNLGFLFAGSSDAALEDLGVDALKANPAVRFAAELGLNYSINPRTFASIGLQYMDLGTDLDLESTDGQNLDRVRLEGSPWIASLGVGWRF
jgi:outer membrane protein W